jgi:hypothetical protein
VQDNTSNLVGELAGDSSLGPTGDGRMKPNLVATGMVVRSASAGTTNDYRDMSGCSMATPHVSGIAASLLEHYSEFRGRPDVPKRWSGADPRIPGIAVPSWLAVTLCLLGRYGEARVQCELALTEARRSRRLHWLAFALGRQRMAVSTAP